MRKPVIYIAGGGTGGHIYPALAIARALLEKNPELEVRFVGTAEGLETRIVPREGFPLDLLQGGKLNFAGQYVRKLITLGKIVQGFFQAVRLLRQYPVQFVLGVGGYASGPFVLAAACLGIPTAIWEPNAHPGLANRWLSHFVGRCYVVFAQAEKLLKNKNVLRLGMPVRKEIENAHAAPAAPGDHQFHLLSFGGSQGSRAISTALSDAVLKGGAWVQDLQVVHQVGSVDYQMMLQKYQGHESTVQVYEFIFDMPKYYAWADLVVARAGASTITELAAFGVVPILIPLPAADDHQLKNAEILAQEGAAVLLLQKDLSAEKLTQEITRLRADPDRLQQMSVRLKKLFQAQAAEKIADDILAHRQGKG